MNPKRQKETMKVSKSKWHYYLFFMDNNDCVQLVIHATVHSNQIV